MSIIETEAFRMGEWLVEPGLLRISKIREGFRSNPVRKLEFKTMETLLCLVAHQGEVVSKQKLHDEVWSEVYVTDNALTRTVSKLRKALDDDPVDAKYVDTISKSGYRLVAPVVHNTQLEASPRSTISSILTRRWVWGLLAVLFVGGLSLMSISSRDLYSGFYDPVPVSTLVGPERAVAISPDGEKISFSYSEPGANNADVYVKLLGDLSQVKFTNLESHQGFGIWSPDGNYMAYASVEDGTCGIYKEPSFGGEKIRIGDCLERPEDFVWSPDGKTIAFTDIPAGQQSRRIFFLDVETHIAEEVVALEAGVSDRDPAFTPDGKYLVFRRTLSGDGRDIYKMRLSDKELTRLTFDNSRIIGLDVFDDGKQIAFSSNRGGLWALWKVPFAGGDVTRFYINDRVPTEPKFSRDGKRMIYKSIQDQTGLWAIEKEGSEVKDPIQVASSTRAEIHPALSADGSKVVFISDRSGFFEIWSNNFKDNSLTKLTSLEGSFVNMPSWSPDGSEVVFDARIDGDNAIYILDVASKLIRTFVDLEGDQVNARFSQDGKVMYFASNHSGSWQIWKKPIFDDGTASVQLTVNGGYYLHEGPDDGYSYYSRADTLGIWRILEELDDTASGGLSEELFISDLSDIDWGNWVPVADGIIYIDRSSGLQVFHQTYDRANPPLVLFIPSKPIQSWSSSLSATRDGGKIIYVQIENSEDEIMMVDFR